MKEQGGEFSAMAGDMGHQVGKALFERALFAGRVPDEVSDSEGSEILAGVPGGQSGDGAVAFVLPDFVPDALRLGGREVNGAQRPGRAERPEKCRYPKVNPRKCMGP